MRSIALALGIGALAWSAAATAQEITLPASGDTATARLDASPRHGEPVEIPIPGEDQTIHSWVYYPERATNAPVVIVIHEIYGLSDWIRGVADQLAAEGFIAVAPDLISGKGPGGGGTDAVGDQRGVVSLVRALTPAEVTTRMNAVRDFALALPAAAGKTATVGFCWGGAASFSYAAAQPGLDAAVVYYGTSPATESLAAIRAPVLGLYGGDDARVNATIPGAETEMNRLGKPFEKGIFEGAGHGFLRQQEGRDGANLRATRAAWTRTIAFLKAHLEDSRPTPPGGAGAVTNNESDSR